MIAFQSVSKAFGEHKVLTDVSLQVSPGEVVALMGENGAGKSTLMRILAGVYPQGSYAGQVLIKNQEVSFKGVPDAKRAGIAMIHQELGLFPELTVAENLLLEEIKSKHALHIPWPKVFDEAQRYLDQLRFKVDARAKVADLRTGLCQLVEIARALRSNASVLIMDEPTSALTEPEVVRLFELLKDLKTQGKAVFYVSHRMEEIAKVADRVVVLRDGIIAGVDQVKNLDRDKIIRWMVGRDVTHIYPNRARSAEKKTPLLEVESLSLLDKQSGKHLVKGASFQLFPGEILGLGGLMGAGRSELALTVFGYFGKKAPHHESFEVRGSVKYNGETILWNEPAKAQASHVALLTEDRKGTGLMLNRPASENMTITVLDKLSNAFGVLRRTQEHSLIKKLAADLKVRGPGLHAEVGVYSGGNQQKVALAKCLALQPKLLILDEPTRGVDIGAKLEIYDIMANLAASGVGILLISSEMPELLGLSDRVVVLCQGQVRGQFEKAEFDPEKIMHAASV
ncbi:MAG: sugar ABC transporter ATP-binding protein [Bdellovibrionota bacterium]